MVGDFGKQRCEEKTCLVEEKEDRAKKGAVVQFF